MGFRVMGLGYAWVTIVLKKRTDKTQTENTAEFSPRFYLPAFHFKMMPPGYGPQVQSSFPFTRASHFGDSFLLIS